VIGGSAARSFISPGSAQVDERLALLRVGVDAVFVARGGAAGPRSSDALAGLGRGVIVSIHHHLITPAPSRPRRRRAQAEAGALCPGKTGEMSRGGSRSRTV